MALVNHGGMIRSFQILAVDEMTLNADSVSTARSGFLRLNSTWGGLVVG